MITTEEKKVKIIADVTLLQEGKVLMVKYSDKNKYDHQSGWFLPDDLVSHGEHPEDAASRILSFCDRSEYRIPLRLLCLRN